MGTWGWKAWIALAGAIACIGMASAATLDRANRVARAPEEAPPCICIGARPASARASDGWHRSTLALAVSSTPDPQPIVGSLGEQLDRNEENAHPLSLDLDEPDHDSEHKLQAELWPRVTAAQSWLRPGLEREGFELVACDAVTARYALWGTEADDFPLAPPRLRQAAWAVASTVLLRSDDPRRLAARLRARSSQPDSVIALVVEPQVSVEGLVELAEHAGRLDAHARRLGRRAPELLGLMSAAGSGVLESPIPLRRHEIAAVPRLGALARLEQFVGEIERELGPRDRVVQRPTGFAREAHLRVNE